MNILKKKKTTLSPDDEYLKWKNEHKDKRIPTYYISIFENEYYYAEASTYTHTQDDTITIKKYEKSRLKRNEVKDKTKDNCSICLSKLQNILSKKYTKLECGHCFHTKCFHKHEKSNKGILLCPLCRSGKSNDDKIIEELKKKNNNFSDNNSDTSSILSYNSY